MLVNNAFSEKRVFQKRKYRSSPRKVFLGKGVPKMCSTFTIEHRCRSAVFEMTLRHSCSPVNLLHIFRAPSTKNTYGGLLLKVLDSQNI